MGPSGSIDSADSVEVLPEHIAVVEQLVCAGAELFIGNAASTFSNTVLLERDRDDKNRYTTQFWGIPPLGGGREVSPSKGKATGGAKGTEANRRGWLDGVMSLLS